MAANYESQASTNYKEAFSLFDKRGNGRVTLDSLGDLLRACGQNPTLSEIRDLEKNVGGDCEFENPLLFILSPTLSGALDVCYKTQRLHPLLRKALLPLWTKFTDVFRILQSILRLSSVS
jgi:hypothetical protein